MWSFNPATYEWTWLSGTNAINQLGVYGLRGVSNSSNFPGARQQHTMAIDSKAKKIYLFGGIGADSKISTSSTFSPSRFRLTQILLGTMNDLWLFDIVSNQWTWLSGENSGSESIDANYGKMGIPHVLNRIGSRRGSSMAINVNEQLLYVFGGSSKITGAGSFGKHSKQNVDSEFDDVI